MPGVQENKAAGQAAEESVASSLRSIHQTGVRTQVMFKFDDGSMRIVDVLDSNCGVCYEVKFGKLAKTKTVINQIAKDLLLRDRHGYKLEVHFFLSPTTGQGGPTRPLQKYLASKNIATHVHNHKVQNCSGACKSCRSSLSQIAHAGSANVKDKHSIEAATMESQALYMAGALKLAHAVAVLALARYASGRVSEATQHLWTKIPRLRQEADRFLAALESFERAFRSEMDWHLHGHPYGDPSAIAAAMICFAIFVAVLGHGALVALALVALICYRYYICETLRDRRLKRQEQMMNLQHRYYDFKKEAAEAARELEVTKSGSKLGVLVGLGFGWLFFGIPGSIVAFGALDAGLVGGLALGTVGLAVGGVAMDRAVEARSGRALAAVDQLLHPFQTTYTLEQAYEELMGIYQKLEREFGIPNWVPTDPCRERAHLPIP